MSRLYYCYVSVFGSNLEVDELYSAIGDPNATVSNWKRQSPDSRSSIAALREGNVRKWESAKEYYVQKMKLGSEPKLWDYTAEEEHIRRCVRRWIFIRNVVSQFRTETTEIWLHLIYRAGATERPAGVFFGKKLLDSVHELGASITTEVIFDDSDYSKGYP